MFGREYKECNIDTLKYKDLSEDDQEVLQAHAKRRLGEWACVLGAAAVALFILVYAWLLNDNGIAFKLIVSVLGLLLFGLAWLFAGKPKLKAKGAISGEIETCRFETKQDKESAKITIDYIATIVFKSSNQMLVEQKVPGTKARINKLKPQDQCPKEGTDVTILKISSKKYMIVYPKYAKKQSRFYIKL